MFPLGKYAVFYIEFDSDIEICQQNQPRVQNLNPKSLNSLNKFKKWTYVWATDRMFLCFSYFSSPRTPERSTLGRHERCRSVAETSQQHYRSDAAALQERCRSAAGALQERSTSAAGALQERCRSAAGATRVPLNFPPCKKHPN